AALKSALKRPTARARHSGYPSSICTAQRTPAARIRGGGARLPSRRRNEAQHSRFNHRCVARGAHGLLQVDNQSKVIVAQQLFGVTAASCCCRVLMRSQVMFGREGNSPTNWASPHLGP